MSEDIELAAKTAGEVVAALAEESGALAVPQEYARYLAARIHYRYYPKLIERAMTAAERIKVSGLPRRAYAALDEPLLTAILEGMAEETGDSLREAWENLLANALTEGSTEVPRAFPKMLSELEPAEAMLLNSIANSQTFTEEPLNRHITVADLADSPVSGVSVESVDNLIRLGILLREEPQDPTWEQLKRRESQIANLRVFGDAGRLVVISTPFGEVGKFYELCQAAEAGTLPGARLTKAATWEVDPSLDEAWKDRKRAELGDDVFRQEYGAEFVAGAGQFFDLREIEFEEAPFRPEDASQWVAGLDPAFHADRFGCALVGEALNDPGAFLVGDVAAIDPGERRRSWEARREREDATLEAVWEVLEPYEAARPLKMVSDQHQADGIRSFFGRKGVEVEITNVTAPIQTAAFVSMRARLVDGSLRSWKHPLLVEELRRIRTARQAESVLLPRFADGHCDAASALALALACYAVREGSHPPAAAVTAPSGLIATGRYSDSVFG